MDFTEKLETLAMTPSDWTCLNQELGASEYRKVVVDYQKREFERLPKCNTAFGLCRNYACGHCTSKSYCIYKKHRQAQLDNDVENDIIQA